MSDQIDRAVKETRRYMYEDGLFEMATGTLILIIGFGLLAWLAFKDTSTTLGVLLLALLFAVAVAGGIFMKRAVERVKRRITYPRTGYVSYKEGETDRGRLVVIVLALLLSALVLFLPDDLSQTSTVVGALLFVVLAVLGYRLSLNRFYATGGFALLVGIFASVLFEDEARGVAVTLILAGTALIFSGALALRSYLTRNPKVEEGAV